MTAKRIYVNGSKGVNPVLISGVILSALHR